MQDDPGKCTETCGALLDCGHTCMSACGVCHNQGQNNRTGADQSLQSHPEHNLKPCTML